MTANTSIEAKGGNRALWTGVILVVLGVAAILLPVFSTLFATTWLAIILLSAGFSKAVYAFQSRDKGGLLWKVLLSVLYIVAGISLLTNPLSGVITITLLLGSFLLTEGVFELILAFRLRPQQGWTWALSNGLVTLGLGAIVWAGWPNNAPWLLGTVVGASVISTGVSRIMLSLNPRAAIASGAAPNSFEQANSDQAASSV